MATSSMSEIHLFNALKSKLGEKESEISSITTKKDLAETKVDIIKWVVGIFFALALMIIGLYLK